MRVSLRKVEKTLEREYRRVVAPQKPDAATVQRLARERGVDSVTAAYTLGKCHGASRLVDNVLAWFAQFGRNQMVADAHHIVSQLTPEEFDALMRRHYDAAH